MNPWLLPPDDPGNALRGNKRSAQPNFKDGSARFGGGGEGTYFIDIRLTHKAWKKVHRLVAKK